MPAISYPRDGGAYAFDVMGEGFGARGPDNTLFLDKLGEISVCWSSNRGCPSDSIRGTWVSDRQLKFSGIKRQYQGMSVQVKVGQTFSNSFPLAMASVSEGMPAAFAALIFSAIVGIVFVTTRRGVGKETIAGKAYGFFSAILLDAETGTYSRSRLQFFLWTSAAILVWLSETSIFLRSLALPKS
jgi:hypothetical protein